MAWMLLQPLCLVLFKAASFAICLQGVFLRHAKIRSTAPTPTCVCRPLRSAPTSSQTFPGSPCQLLSSQQVSGSLYHSLFSSAQPLGPSATLPTCLFSCFPLPQRFCTPRLYVDNNLLLLTSSLPHSPCLIAFWSQDVQISMGAVGRKFRSIRGNINQENLRPLNNQTAGTTSAVSLGGQAPSSQAYYLFCVQSKCHTQHWWLSMVP